MDAGALTRPAPPPDTHARSRVVELRASPSFAQHIADEDHRGAVDAGLRSLAAMVASVPRIDALLRPTGALHDRRRRSPAGSAAQMRGNGVLEAPAERKMAIVARCAASEAISCPGGTGVRPGLRVMITVCETPGSVSSVGSAAAAARKELTPGTTA